MDLVSHVIEEFLDLHRAHDVVQRKHVRFIPRHGSSYAVVIVQCRKKHCDQIADDDALHGERGTAEPTTDEFFPFVLLHSTATRPESRPFSLVLLLDGGILKKPPSF